jgi:hypothetical protein
MGDYRRGDRKGDENAEEIVVEPVHDASVVPEVHEDECGDGHGQHVVLL